MRKENEFRFGKHTLRAVYKVTGFQPNARNMDGGSRVAVER